MLNRLILQVIHSTEVSCCKKRSHKVNNVPRSPRADVGLQTDSRRMSQIYKRVLYCAREAGVHVSTQFTQSCTICLKARLASAGILNSNMALPVHLRTVEHPTGEHPQPHSQRRCTDVKPDGRCTDKGSHCSMCPCIQRQWVTTYARQHRDSWTRKQMLRRR